MRHRSSARLVHRLALVLSLLSLTLRVHAQPQPSPQDLNEAKRHFEAGLKLYAEHALPAALAEFQTTYRLSRRPTALRNVAQCYRDLQQFAEAYDAYQELLTKFGSQLGGEAASVRRALEDLSMVTGTLKVTVNEQGALVEVDGKSVGSSPVPPKRLSVGGHTLRISKEGFAPFQKDFAVSPQQTVDLGVALEHESSTGHLAVREQAGRSVHVFIDSKDVGPTPWEGDLSPGNHMVEVRGDKIASVSRTVKLAKGDRFDLVLDASFTGGHLRITTLPASASIAVDGSSVGTGAWEGDLDPGTHNVEVSLAGHPSVARQIVLVRGQTVVEEVPVPDAGGGGVAAEGPEYRGWYGRVGLFWAFSTSAQHTSVAGPLVTAPPDQSFPLGFGVSVRAGYTFDIVGLELVGAFMFDHFEDQLHFSNASGGSAFVETLDNSSVNLFLGFGPRITSRDPTVRFTAGLAPGLVVRDFIFKRSDLGNGTCASCQGPTEFTSGGGYVAPALTLDGGVLLGGSPGVKFFLGAYAWLDFAPQIVVGPDASIPIDKSYFPSADRGWILANGPQFYFGPVLGAQFGH